MAEISIYTATPQQRRAAQDLADEDDLLVTVVPVTKMAGLSSEILRLVAVRGAGAFPLTVLDERILRSGALPGADEVRNWSRGQPPDRLPLGVGRPGDCGPADCC
jgi:hypothetical protein